MYTHEYSNISCGVLEITELNANVEDFIRTAREAGASADRKWPVVIFSDVVRARRHGHNGRNPHYGLRLSRALEERYPGSVIESKRVVNDNTGNTIAVWIFHPPRGFYMNKKEREKWLNDEERFLREAW